MKPLSDARKLKMAERVKAWNAANPDRARNHQRKYWFREKYGLTIEAYDAMLKEQLGRCAICLSKNPGIWRDFVVDHDHSSGKVRGLLCSFCNSGLGMFKDDPSLLIKAQWYLARFNEET